MNTNTRNPRGPRAGRGRAATPAGGVVASRWPQPAPARVLNLMPTAAQAVVVVYTPYGVQTYAVPQGTAFQVPQSWLPLESLEQEAKREAAARQFQDRLTAIKQRAEKIGLSDVFDGVETEEALEKAFQHVPPEKGRILRLDNRSFRASMREIQAPPEEAQKQVGASQQEIAPRGAISTGF